MPGSRVIKCGLPFVVLAILRATIAFAEPDDQHAIAIDDVVKAWEARAQNVRTLQFKWTEPYLLSRWAPHSLSPEGSKGAAKDGASPDPNPRSWEPRLSLAIDGDKICFEKEDLILSPFGRLVPQASVWGWTVNEYRQVYEPGGVAYSQGYVSKSILATWHPGNDPYVAPLLMTYRPFHPALGTFENFANRFRIVAGKHEVRGRQCILLQDEPQPWSGLVISLYLDPERDFLPIRLDSTVKLDRHRIDFLEYDKNDENWVLVRWKCSVAVGSINGPLVSEAKLNGAVDARKFELEFPPGTWVKEKARPTTYIVKEGGVQRTITTNEQFSGKKYEDFLNTATGELAPGPDTTNDEAARAEALANHRMVQLSNLKGRSLWSIVIVRQEDVEVRVEPVGTVHPREPIEVAVSDASCDQMLFGISRNAAVARRELAARLSEKIEAVDQMCGLSDAQKSKLELAGRGEILRFFKRVEELRPRIKRVYDQSAVQKGELDPAVIKLCQETRPLRCAVDSGAFEDGSMFIKTLKTTLTPEQAAKYDQAELKVRGNPPTNE